MTGETIKGLDPNPFDEPDFEFKSYEEHMEDINKGEAENTEEVEENPNKRKYLEDLKECEEKLDALQEKFADSLDEANTYVNAITRLLNDNRATDEVIQGEVNKLKKAIQDVERNSGDLLAQNEEFGDYLKLDDDFLTPEEHGIRHDKYFNNIEAMNKFTKIEELSEDVLTDVRRREIYRHYNN